MAEKDVTEKTLEAYNDVFADIVNVLLFNGDKVIKPNSLTDATSTSQYKVDGRIHEQERDVAKYWKNGNIRLAIYGLENQTTIDKDMPLRVIGYDGAVYRGQLCEEKESAQKRKRYPVVTLILYFGIGRWNKNKRLLECLKVPERLAPYVSDYKINVFEIAYLTPEQVNLFQSDFKIVADYFVQKRLHEDYKPTHEALKHVDEILKLMTVLTKDIRYEDKINDFIGRSDVTMCEVLDKIEARGEARGKAEGKEEQILEFAEIMLRNNEPISKIQAYTKLTVKRIKEIAAQIGVAVVI